MQTYEVKRGLPKKTDLKALLQQHFGSAREDAGWFAASFGAMPTIKAKYENEKLVVDTQNDPNLAPRIAKGDQDAMKLAMDTQRRWNDFLFGATGYDAKTRGKKAQAAVKKSTPAV
jgi:hypothetical protein